MKKEKSRVLIVVDMQNDFVTGALANKDAEAIIPKIKDFVINFDSYNNGDEYNNYVIFTMDTHYRDYMNTTEGKHLPIEHCIDNTTGYALVDDIGYKEALNIYKNRYFLNMIQEKSSFANFDLYCHLADDAITEVYLCGTCTDICVISNALMAKNVLNTYNNHDTEIYVLADLCAGTTPENHNKALDIMKCCHINVI